MKDYTIYKTNISLPDFLKKEYGYEVQRGSSGKSLRLENSSGHLVVVSRNDKGYYTYFEPHTNVRGATIIDFVRSVIASNKGLEIAEIPIYEVANILDEYMKSDRVVLSSNSEYHLTTANHSPDFIYKEVQGMKNIIINDFLSKRGIKEETLQSKEFSEIFKSKLFRDTQKKAVYENTCVIMASDKNSFNAYSQRGESFKGCIGSRNSLATSNHDSSKEVDIYFIGESMIDAVSHFQMNREALFNKNVVYFSTEGSLINGQIEILQKSINKIKPKTVVQLFDRDIAGLLYTLKLTGNIINPDDKKTYSTSMDIEIDKPNKSAYLTFTFNDDKDISINDRLVSINELIKDERILSSVEDPQSIIEINTIKSQDNINISKVTIPYNKDSFLAVQDHLESLRFKEKYLYIDRPITNDFNDDLRLKQDNHPYWKIERLNGNEIKIIFQKENNSFSRILSQEEKNRLFSDLKNNNQITL